MNDVFVECCKAEVAYHSGCSSNSGEEDVLLDPVVERERGTGGVQVIQQDSPAAPLPDSTPLFTTISNGTTKKEWKHVSNDGYEYSITKIIKNSVNWKYTLRTKCNICGATVI